jgi:N-acetylglucosamine malate deacetylase 1
MFKNYLRRLEALINRRSAYKFFIRDWVALGDLRAATQVLNTTRFSRNLEPVEMPAPDARRIVVIAPHPDDEIIGPGGTLLRALDQGAKVLVVYLTSGAEAEGAVREAEADGNGEALGFDRVYLRYREWAIPDDDRALARITAAIRDFNPDAVFVPFFLDDHDDHRRASHILAKASAAGLLDLRLPIWAYQVYTAVLPNVIVDITATRERKAEAIRRYASQMVMRDWANFALGLNAWNSRFLSDRTEAAFAEAFFVLPLAEYAAFAGQYFEPAGAQAYYTSRYHAD